MSFSTRFHNGQLITKTSLLFARQNKKILLFVLLPIPLFITAALFYLFFSIIVFLLIDGINHSQSSPHDAKLLFGSLATVCGALCIWTLTSISLFFKSAMSHYVAHKVQHQPASVTRSCIAMFARLKVIVMFAGLTTALGLALRALRNKSNKSSSIATSIIGWLLHASIAMSWSIITFLMIPIIALEETSTVESLKLSAQTFKKTWGESIIGSFSIGAVILVSILGYIAAACASSFVLPFIIGLPLTTLLLIISTMMFLFFLFLITSTISVIFQTIVYLYATQGITGPFNKNLLAHSFEVDQSKK